MKWGSKSVYLQKHLNASILSNLVISTNVSSDFTRELPKYDLKLPPQADRKVICIDIDQCHPYLCMLSRAVLSRMVLYVSTPVLSLKVKYTTQQIWGATVVLPPPVGEIELEKKLLVGSS